MPEYSRAIRKCAEYYTGEENAGAFKLPIYLQFAVQLSGY